MSYSLLKTKCQNLCWRGCTQLEIAIVDGVGFPNNCPSLTGTIAHNSNEARWPILGFSGLCLTSRPDSGAGAALSWTDSTFRVFSSSSLSSFQELRALKGTCTNGHPRTHHGIPASAMPDTPVQKYSAQGGQAKIVTSRDRDNERDSIKHVISALDRDAYIPRASAPTVVCCATNLQ